MNAVLLEPSLCAATAAAVSIVPVKPTLVEPLPVHEDDVEERATVGPYRQWNPSAVACYLRNANCDGCFYQKFFDSRNYGCHMAAAVQHLIKRVGPPDARRIQRCV